MSLCLGWQFNGSVELIDLLVRFAGHDAEPGVLANIQILCKWRGQAQLPVGFTVQLICSDEGFSRGSRSCGTVNLGRVAGVHAINKRSR